MSDRLEELEARYDQHKQVSYELPHSDAPCWPAYRQSGVCGCQAEPDFEWLIAEVARLRAALEQIAHTITRESATSQQAEHAWFLASFALKDPPEHAEPEADDGLA